MQLRRVRAGLAALLCWTMASTAEAQIDVTPHKDAADRLIAAALRDSAAYQRLARFVDEFGPRHSGSLALERSLDWIVAQMKADGFENVRKEPVTVTDWVRGEESLELLSPRQRPMRMLGLGRSVGTPEGGIRATVLVVRSFAELRARADEARGRIVLFNVPFDTTVHPFTGYGRTVIYRANGADSASSVGAVAVLVRSVTPHSLNTPHTGGMAYDESGRLRRIPAAAITVEDAEMLQRMQDRGERIEVRLRMDARTSLLGARSYNVVGEITGSEKPDEIIVMGGHIDSWDVGQGAMDDAGGCFATWEALRLIKELGVRPKRTIRVVMWTNEELGLAGATAYRDAHRDAVDKHVLAMESDNGVFRPLALLVGAGEGGVEMMQSVASLLAAAGIDSAAAGGPQADISPLYQLGVPVAAVATDASKYFWYHHSDSDTVDKLDPVDLARNVAAFAVMAYTFANLEETLPRVP